MWLTKRDQVSPCRLRPEAYINAMNTTPNKLAAPLAEKKPVTHDRFGQSWTDDYAWMKDDNWQAVMSDPSLLDKGIRQHLEAENAFTNSVLSKSSDLKDAIFEEMKGRLEPNARSTPLPDGPFNYFHFYREGDQHGVYARAPIAGGDDQVMLDADALAKMKKGFFDLGTVSHSHDHAWLAYSVDRQGSENYAVFIQELGGERLIETDIKRSAGGLIWAADNHTLFWTERDENQRPYAVRYTNVFDDSDVVHTAYEESDPGFFVGVGASDDRRHIEVSAHNHTTSEVWRIPANAPATQAVCFAPRLDGQEYSLFDQGGKIYILTNANGAKDFAVMATTPDKPEREHWKSFIPHAPGTLILGMEAFEHFLVRLERKSALPRIVIRDMRSGEEHRIEMNESAYSLGLISAYEYDTTKIFFSYASPTTPSQVYRYDMENRDRHLVKEQVVPSGHEADDYRTKRLNITARDGERIPVTLLYRKDLKPDGAAPLLLYGYGSYGITIPAGFRTRILSLVDRGFVYAIAHIRGGMAKGYQWYLDGKLEKKTNTFNDYVDVGRGLIDLGWTGYGRIIGHGGSAGGLLVGAAVNQAPELFGGVIAAVPFVDVLNTMSDEELPLTPPEWPEWGNPLTDEAAFNRIRSYSPYDNVSPQDYPAMLITGGLTDPRVTYWEPAKWAAVLRENQTGDDPILLKINMTAGHAGESGRYDSLKEAAEEYAFAVAVATDEL